ncbi:armadillo-type protein [Lophiotrema nucula]|uniref:Pumilio homology domain family member 3 n=1 Tax=Lophiotrema nucula TaxID=690887 RepID=A0A6A5ZJ65_9PLEO|nr:armadillo-type protein [Lophiotrema nucula]
MSGMTNNARNRDFANGVSLNGADGDRASHSTLSHGFNSGWGSSIWGNSSNALGTGFGSAARDSSRSRENGAHAAENIEGKTGSGSLVASSESDPWNQPAWTNNSGAAMPHTRGSGVSPARKGSMAQAQSSQQYTETPANSFYPASRGAVLGPAPVGKPPKSLLDPTSGNFSTARQIEPLNTSTFSNFAFGQNDTNQQRPDPSVGSWPDTASVHSPNDDRRSIANSEYFGPSSAAQSRNNSLPPSRHGAEPLQYPQNGDLYPRNGLNGQRQHSSFSYGNGRAFNERSGSMQSDSLQMLGRLSLEQQDQEAAFAPHRSSISISGLTPTFTPANESTYSQDHAPDVQPLGRAGHAVYSNGNAGHHTPDTFVNGHAADPNAQFNQFRFDTRSAPNGTAAQQSPFISHSHTPPPYDHLYPSRIDQTLSNATNLAHLQNRLQGYQLQQERRNYNSAAHYRQPNLQQYIAANQLNNPYNFQFGIPTGLPMNGIPASFQMQPIPNNMPIAQPPTGPREQAQPEGHMSRPLWDFKQSSKTSKRWELTDIYGHVVEFSGDQHGSRFIQQKLETANSDQKDQIFKELQGESLQLMQDVFGNYVIQKFFEHGDQTQKRILAHRMKGHVLALSVQMYGCRVALEHILTDQQAAIVQELDKDVLRCVKDQNGNHVIQKAIERVPAEHIQFIIQAFKGQVGGLAVHQYGCRVIQRMLEYCEPPAQRFILDELHAEGAKLITDSYGNYVTQHIIEHGDDEDRAKVIALVKKDLLIFSKHKFASNVVERCLIYGTDQQRREIMLKVTEKPERGESIMLNLIKDSYGNYVIQKILDMLNDDDYDEMVAIMKPEMEKAKKFIAGKQMISVEKKMHRHRHDSVSPRADSIAMPMLSNSVTQSPQSSSLPSANTSTVDEPVHNTLSDNTLSDKDHSSTPTVTPAIGERDYKALPDGTPSWKGNIPVGHGGTLNDANGRRFGKVILNWLLYTFKSNTTALDYLNSGYKADNWTVETHQFDLLKPF